VTVKLDQEEQARERRSRASIYDFVRDLNLAVTA